MKITQEELYKRQTTLAEIGAKGQEKLVQTKVLIIGCGGLGSTAAVYLAASGVGSIHLVDFDTISLSNLHRQVFYNPNHLNKLKVEVLAAYLKKMSPFVKVNSTNKALTKENVFKTIADVDFVLDCTDSLPTKYLLNDACVLQDKTLIYGSLYKFDGYVASFNIKQADGSYSANLRDAFPKIPTKSIPNCSEIGTLNSIVGMIAMLQANEVLKLTTGIGAPLENQLLIYNSLENSQFKMQLKKGVTKQEIQASFENEKYIDLACQVQDEMLLISNHQLRKKLSYGEASKKLYIISVIEDVSTKLPFQVHQKTPLSTLDLEKESFNHENEYVMVCNKGISSYIATQRIKEKYPDLKVWSLKNGITNY